jgi:hypothetical protein
MKRDILFSVFMKSRGASPVFYTREVLTDADASRVALKSQMTLSMMNSAELESAEAILPFSDLSVKMIGFIYLFQIECDLPQDQKCIAGLTYLVSQENQAFLYSKVPFLKYTAEDLASKIKRGYVAGEGRVFSQELRNYMNEWIVTERDSTAEVQIIEKRVILSEKTDTGSIDFFLSQIKKNEDIALGGLFRGDPIIITGGSHVMVDLIVHSLDLFIPKVVLRKVSYTTEIVDPSQADIIGVSKALQKRYPDEILIDIDKKQVKNGKSCGFSKEIIKNIKKNPAQTEIILNRAYQQILEVANLLIDVFSYPEDQREALIENVRKEHNEALIEVSVDLAAKRNPLIRELLFQHVSNRFLEWMDGF